MRDHVLFYVNGNEHRVTGEDVFTPLSTYLREKRGLTGTKVVCEEGDCGACTVILGQYEDGKLVYETINACIQFIYQLDCCHVISVEGVKEDGELNACQKSMVEHHGAQCGFCTPGFITAMCTMYNECEKVDETTIKDWLVGNLCRCTGYEPIIKAGLDVDRKEMVKLDELYPPKEMLTQFKALENDPVLIDWNGKKCFIPVDVDSCVKFKSENEGTVIVMGGTDVNVFINKRDFDPKDTLVLTRVKDTKELEIKDGVLHVGAKVNLLDLEKFAKEHIPALKHMLWLFGSPQIRIAGTLAGNVANGSPIGDTPPFLFVCDAQIELTGKDGKRTVPIRKFIKGYKQFDLNSDEMITKITIPLPGNDDVLKLYKVSRRQNLDISTFSAAFKMTQKNGTIDKMDIAFGGVAATTLRMVKTEEFLAGKEFSLDTFEAAGKIARDEVTPISDVRGSEEYRRQLAENIFSKFYYEAAADGETVCQ